MIFQNYHPVGFLFFTWNSMIKNKNIKEIHINHYSTCNSNVPSSPQWEAETSVSLLLLSWNPLLATAMLALLYKIKNKVSLNQELSCFPMSCLILTCESRRNKKKKTNPEEPGGYGRESEGLRLSVSVQVTYWRKTARPSMLVHIYTLYIWSWLWKASWGSDSGTSSRSDPLGTSLKREHALCSLPGRLFAPTPCKDERRVGFCVLVSAAVRGQSSRRSGSQQMSLHLFLSPSSFHWLLSM